MDYTSAMCGILGVLNYKNLDSTSFKNLLDQTLKHRGPDDSGTYQDPSIMLGHRRLSIIDLAGGHQPMFNQDKSKVIVFNGEIYNFKVLRRELESRGCQFQTHSDTEVILKLHETYEPHVAIAKLNGIFSYALWDIRTQELILARDHYGIKPLFYKQDGESLSFASEASSLKGQVDLASLQQFLFFEYIPAPRTVYQNVFKLMPGHFLIAKNGRSQINRYYEIPKPPVSKLPASEIQKQIEAQLSQSIQMQLVSDVPIGVFLSGGIDSSLIAHYAAQHHPGIQTFSIAFEDPSYDESRFFSQVSQSLNIKSHVKTLKASEILGVLNQVIPKLDEPLGDPSILPTYLLSQFAREHVTVALSGDGADELFGGYPTYFAHQISQPYAALPKILRKGISKIVHQLPVSHKNISWDFKLKRFVSGFEFDPAIQHQVWMGGWSPDLLQNLFEKPLDIKSLFEPLTRNRFKDFVDQDFQRYLQDDLLVKTDRASMLNSLEVRVPFLDPDLVQLAYSIPTHLKHRGMTTKYILRKIASEKLPASISNRPKKGFGIPVSKWLQHELKDVLMAQIDVLENQNLGIKAAQIRKMAENHFQNRANYRKELWQVLVLGLWLKGQDA